MKEHIVVTLLFLVLHICFNNAHTLSKIEMNNITLYEMKEDQSSLSIAHPKDDKPMIRDIVYYHIIEKPYEGGYETVDNKTTDIERSPVDYKRSFTNGHGLQYINEDGEVIDHSKEDDDNDKSEQSSEEHESDEINEDDRGENEETTTVANTSDKANDKNDDRINEKKDSKEHESIKTDGKPLLDDADKTVDVDVRFGAEGIDKNTEAPDVTQEKPGSRRKREIDYSNLSDAPSLPEFNLDILPDFIKAILNQDSDTNYNSEQADNFEKEIEKQVRKLEEAVNRPPSDNINVPKREAKTYGMSLTGDRGVVWNDLSDAHVAYHVGEPEIVTSTTSIPEVVTTMRTTIDESSKETSSNGDKDENIDSEELKDIEASFDEIDKMLDELIKEGDNITDVTEANKDHISSTTEKQNDVTTEVTKLTTETTTEPSKEIAKNRDDESKQKEFVKELMKNKFFWRWLQDSSTAYLEIVTKKLDVLIKAEVEKQIKQFVEHNIIDKNNAILNNTSENPIQSNNVTDVNDNNVTQNPIGNKTDINNITPNNTVDTNNVNKTEELPRKHNNKESNNHKEIPVKIEAKNVYGNSVGNEKVTNIFIFNIGNNTGLENLRPISNGTDGVLVFGLDDKKPDQCKEENKTEHDIDAKPDKDKISPEKPEEVKTENPNDSIVESTTSNDIDESIKNSHTTSTPEVTTSNDDKKIPTSTTEVETPTTKAAKEPSIDLSNEETGATILKPNDDKEPTTSTTEKASEPTTEAAKEPSKDLGNESTSETEKEGTPTENPKESTESESTVSIDTDNVTSPTTDENKDSINSDKTEDINQNSTDDKSTTESTNKDGGVSDTDDKTNTGNTAEKIYEESLENEVDHKE